MDESSRIIAELQRKLQELNDKVAAFGQGLAAEYTRYADKVLEDVSDDVSSKVKNAIADGMTMYPSLVEAFVHHNAPEQAANAASTCDPLSTSATDVTSVSARSPQLHGTGLTGLFTPSYLPLLDSIDRNQRRSSSDTSPVVMPAPGLASHTPTNTRRANSVPTVPISSSYEPSVPKPPTPRRRNTDEVSVLSDSSDGPKRRSALRRTSSASTAKAHSPRRVRFEVEGEEVTTTSSPKPPAPIEELSEPAIESIEPSLLDSDDDEAGSAFVEDVNDPAPPKRVSSSQALRALSRAPKEEDGVQWTAVAAPPDGSAAVSVADLKEDTSDDDQDFFEIRSKKKAKTPEIVAAPPIASPTFEYQGRRLSSAEERALVEMRSVYEPEAQTKSVSEAAIREKVQPAPQVEDDNTDDDLFGMEEAGKKETKKYLQDEASDDDDDDKKTAYVSSGSALSKDITPRATPISTPMGSLSTRAVNKEFKIGSNTARDSKVSSSVQSENAEKSAPATKRVSFHPFESPVVDPVLHEALIEEDSLGTSFVGSLHRSPRASNSTYADNGREMTRVQEMARSLGDATVFGSFKDAGLSGSLANGGPRSLSERMQLEDYMDALAAEARAR